MKVALAADEFRNSTVDNIMEAKIRYFVIAMANIAELYLMIHIIILTI